MDAFWQDIRLAFRTIRKNPGVTAVAVLSLALGVGANTTIFTLLNAALLGSLPVARPSELVAVYTTDQSNIGGFGNLNATSYLNFKDLRERGAYVSAMAGYSFPQFVSVITLRPGLAREPPRSVTGAQIASRASRSRRRRRPGVVPVASVQLLMRTSLEFMSAPSAPRKGKACADADAVAERRENW